MTQKLFYAVREDCGPVLAQVEAANPLSYVTTGQFQGETYSIFDRGDQIPGLGAATAETGTSSASYLVLPKAERVVPRPIQATQRLAIDQLANPDSVIFTPAGRWKDIILSGRVATVSRSPAAQSLMRRFESALKKHFVKVGAYWVGPRAKQALDSGVRLTIAEQSAPEFDLGVGT